MTRVIDGMTVDVERMRSNLETAGGLLFSHRVLLALIRDGMGRDQAYRAVQSASAEALRTGRDLRDMFAGTVDADAFSLEPYLAGAADPVDHLAKITVEWLRERRSGW
jgi:adenylosuccinate lyase